MWPGHFLYQTIDMLLGFLTIQKIWHLHEISLVSDTWHAVKFPRFPWLMTHDMLLYCLEILTSTWNFLGQNAVIFPINVQNLDIYMRFTIVFLCEKVHNICVKQDTPGGLWKGGKNELWHYIVWVSKEKRSQPTENICLFHKLYALMTNKCIKIVDYCNYFARVTVLLEYLHR